MTNFERVTSTQKALSDFLSSLPVLKGPWDDEFHKRYCVKCLSLDCDYCPHEKFRNNPEWWLALKARKKVKK